MTAGVRAPLRNVVFDFGGVLVNWRPQEIIDTFYAEPHLREALRTHAFQHEDWLDMDRGTLDEASVVRRCAERMARPESELRALFEHVRAALTPIEPTVALLRELRQRSGLKLYGLSNMSEAIFAHLDERHDFFKLFDGIVVSAAVKLVKPEPAIYEHLRERFALDFTQSVFIGDLARNVDSARRVGLPAIQFVSTDQVRRELEPLL
jgi:putative hydrolase of the HAD superfamily